MIITWVGKELFELCDDFSKEISGDEAWYVLC